MSKEEVKSELDLFENVRFQNSIERSDFIQYRPITTIENSNTYEFEINAGPDEYIDIQNIYLWMSVKIHNKNNDNFDDNLGTKENYSTISYPLNTIFDQLSIYLGSTLITQASNNYSYLSYIEALIEPTNRYNTFGNSLCASTSGFVSPYWKNDYNPDHPHEQIYKLARKSKHFTLYGKMHGALFSTNKYLLNGIPIKFIFTKASNNFIVIGREGWLTNDTHPVFKLNNIQIYVRKVKINANLLIAHAKALQIAKAKYPIKRPEIKVINLPSGQSSFSLNNIITGQLPNKIVLGMVSHNAYVGTNNSNSLRFQHFGLNYLDLNVNGNMLPRIPYEPDFRTDHQDYQREYYEFLMNSGSLEGNFPLQIDYEDYAKAFCLFAFNLKSDLKNHSNILDIPKSGFINIDVRFQENLSQPVKMIIYTQFDNIIEIDEHRNVTTDY